MTPPRNWLTHCMDCGAVLMGGLTRHKPWCVFYSMTVQGQKHIQQSRPKPRHRTRRKRNP